MINSVVWFIPGYVFGLASGIVFWYYVLAKEILERDKKKSATTRRKAIPKAIRQFIKERDNYTCTECSRKDCCNFHLDHIVPVVDGGGDEPENLRLTCASCNLRRGRKPIANT